MLEQVHQAVGFIRERCDWVPRLGLILGSGLGYYADQLQEAISIPFSEIPHFPQSSIEGHAGKLVLGLAEGVPAVAMQGRVHYYEGYTQQQITFPMRVMGMLGIK